MRRARFAEGTDHPLQQAGRGAGWLGSQRAQRAPTLPLVTPVQATGYVTSDMYTGGVLYDFTVAYVTGAHPRPPFHPNRNLIVRDTQLCGSPSLRCMHTRIRTGRAGRRQLHACTTGGTVGGSWTHRAPTGAVGGSGRGRQGRSQVDLGGTRRPPRPQGLKPLKLFFFLCRRVRLKLLLHRRGVARQAVQDAGLRKDEQVAGSTAPAHAPPSRPPRTPTEGLAEAALHVTSYVSHPFCVLFRCLHAAPRHAGPPFFRRSFPSLQALPRRQAVPFPSASITLWLAALPHNMQLPTA